MSKTFLSILGGLGGMFGWGISDFFANISSEKVGHTKTVFWSQLAGMLVLGLFMILTSFKFSVSPSLWLLFIFSSVLYLTAYIFFYKAFEIGNVTVVSTTLHLDAITSIILAFIFKGQRLTSFQTAGIFLVILGVTLVSLNIKELLNSKVSLLAGVKETIIASFCFGTFWYFSETLSEETGWLATSFIVKVISLVLLFSWFLLKKQSVGIKKKNLNLFPLIALIGILEAGAVASVNYGIEVGDLILVSPISSALSVVTITLAVIFLKEKISKVQLAGIILTICGIILTAF